MFIDFREREEKEEGGMKGGGEKRDTHIDMQEKHQLAASCIRPNRTCNLGMCPHWESNLQPLGVWMML